MCSTRKIFCLCFSCSPMTLLSRGEPSEGLIRFLAKKYRKRTAGGIPPLRFYTEFSNPSKTVYSWNRSLPSSRDMFARGGLAVYFGYGGEITGLREKNPHLNFDIAPVPQIRDRRTQKTFGRMTALAVAKNSSNVETAFAVAYALTGATVSRQIGDILFAAGAARPPFGNTNKCLWARIIWRSAHGPCMARPRPE